jgi:nucleoredoxin
MQSMKFVIVAVCLAMGSLGGWAQNANPAPASDDPTAGLNLGDTLNSSSSSNPNSNPSSGSITTPSPFVARLTGHLIVMVNGQPKAFDASTLKGVKYWAFYRSASWCPPCRAFTPKLVAFYNSFKKTHPDFELVFVSHDRSEQQMLGYMKQDKMTWPCLKYADWTNPQIDIAKVFGKYIPDLVLVDGNGTVLSDTNQGEDYLGPERVLADIPKMVPASTATYAKNY